jgi:nucleotide-binding universal stress UspA family protein
VVKPAIRRLLVPVDFSAGSDAATGYAAVLGAALGASIHLLHVLEEPFVTQGSWAFVEPDPPERRERIVADRQARLAGIASRFRPACDRVTTEVRSGEAANAIITVATDRGADLIVMGTHGRTGWSHLVHGSVAEHVIRKAPCPVLAVCERRAGDVMSIAIAADAEKPTDVGESESAACTSCKATTERRST